MPALAFEYGNDCLHPACGTCLQICQRIRKQAKRCALDQRQIPWQNQPAMGILRGPHRCRNRIPHTGMARVFQMPGQAAGAHGVQHVVQHRLTGQQGAQLVRAAARSEKALAPPGGENEHCGACCAGSRQQGNDVKPS